MFLIVACKQMNDIAQHIPNKQKPKHFLPSNQISHIHFAVQIIYLKKKLIRIYFDISMLDFSI